MLHLSRHSSSLSTELFICLSSAWLSSWHLLWAIKYLLNEWLLVPTSHQASSLWLPRACSLNLTKILGYSPILYINLKLTMFLLSFFKNLLSSVRSYRNKYHPPLISLLPNWNDYQFVCEVTPQLQRNLNTSVTPREDGSAEKLVEEEGVEQGFLPIRGMWQGCPWKLWVSWHDGRVWALRLWGAMGRVSVL